MYIYIYTKQIYTYTMLHVYKSQYKTMCKHIVQIYTYRMYIYMYANTHTHKYKYLNTTNCMY